MKKFVAFILLLITCSALTVQAEPVTPDRALDIAKVILADQQQPGMSYGGLQVVWTGPDPVTKADDNPPYYVIASSLGGFVIISGNDNVRPVLALSEGGRFSTDDMPDNVRIWMEDMAAYVRSVTEQSAEVRALWDAYAATKSAVITGEITNKVEHLTPEWNQGNSDMYYFGRNVYNARCPQQNGQLVVTGCVATAMAEVFTTQSGLYPDTMPTHGSGTVGGYSVDDDHVAPAAYELGTVYDWAGLRSLTNDAAIIAAINRGDDALLDNLAQLMADCGAMVEMNYSVNGSGAVTANVPNYAAKHMGYNKSAHVEQPYYYSRTQWERMLTNELAKRPMIYAANGHAFVFDGYGEYDGDWVFHVNFGWGGSCNGYYYQFNMNTGSGNYSSDYAVAIFDFYPNPDSEYTAEIKLADWGYTGFQVPASIPVGERFSLSVGAIYNAGTADFTGVIRASLVDRNDAFKVELESFNVGESIGELPPRYGWTLFSFDNCLIPEGTALSFGDKIILEYCLDADNPVYQLVQYPVNGTFVGELPLYPSAFIAKKADYAVGDYFDFLLMNQNYAYGGTRWYITTPSGEKQVYTHSEGSIRLTQSGTYKIVAEVYAYDGDVLKESISTKITVH